MSEGGGGGGERKAETIKVPSKGGEPKEEDEKRRGKKKPSPTDELEITPETLSEEDAALKQRLEEAVERLASGATDDASQAEDLELLSKDIREATATMSSVPKPLKFLSPHYETLRTYYEGLPESSSNKRAMADVMAVLSMTLGATGERETLKYHMLGRNEDVAAWGHEYVRALSGQVGDAWTERVTADPPQDTSDLLPLVRAIVPFFMGHNAEAEGIDLLMEADMLRALTNGFGDGDKPIYESLDEHSHARVCIYLLRCAEFASDDDELAELMDVALTLYRQHGQLADALRVALRMRNYETARELLLGCDDMAMKRQMAFILGRHRAFLELPDDMDGDDQEQLETAMGNSLLTAQFKELVKELDVGEPKTPEDIYKSHLADTGSTARGAEGADVPESAKANLASTYVNAFVNACYGKDKLVLAKDSRWIYRNAEHGKIAAAASSGMILQWDVDEQNQLDKLIEVEDDDYVKAGGYLSIGLCCTGVMDSSNDICFALLSETLEEDSTASHDVKVASVLGLGLTYAGSCREDVIALLTPYVVDTSATANIELVAFAAYALGLVCVGSANVDTMSVIADRLIDDETKDVELDHALARHMCLGLALHFLGRGSEVETMCEGLAACEHPIRDFCIVLMRACAYAGSGNVLQVQALLHICAEHPEADAEGSEEAKAADASASGGAGGDSDSKEADAAAAAKRAKYMHMSMAVLGLGMVAMGEDLGREMTRRMTEHLLQYGDPSVRRVVPLAIAMQNLSDPHEYTVVETLSKLTHDNHSDTAQAAIFALGLVGAGTNHSRIAGLLRQLTVFYAKEPQHLFMTRIAQGLLHMGKGLLTINPYHSDRFLLSGVAMGGLLGAVLCGLDLQATVHSKFHTLLFSLATAMNPRMLFLVDESDVQKPLTTTVRVGNAMDTAGQPGRPKTISGFQTHDAPVLLGAEQRAELADEDSLEALTTVLEGVVIVREKKADEAGASGAAAAKDR